MANYCIDFAGDMIIITDIKQGRFEFSKCLFCFAESVLRNQFYGINEARAPTLLGQRPFIINH